MKHFWQFSKEFRTDVEVYSRSVSLSAIVILKKTSLKLPVASYSLPNNHSPYFFLCLPLEVNCIGSIITGNQQLLISALKTEDLLQRY